MKKDNKKYVIFDTAPFDFGINTRERFYELLDTLKSMEGRKLKSLKIEDRVDSLSNFVSMIWD